MSKAHRTRRVRLVAASAVVSTALVASCKEPTSISVLVRTNVPYVYERNLSVALFIGAEGQATNVPAADTRGPWGTDGLIGTLTATPANAHDAAVEVRVVMGIGRDPTSCDPVAAGCIVSRRLLRFRDASTLRVPVTLYLQCDGVGCASDATCNYVGKCVPARVDQNACATAAGCPLEGDMAYDDSRAPAAPPSDAAGSGDGATSMDATTPDDATVANDATMTNDAASDSSGDASSDASTPDASDAANDGGIGGIARVFSGPEASCALLVGGGIKCWGVNNNGILGYGDATWRGDSAGTMGAALPMVDLGTGLTVAEVAIGQGHACARFTDGRVKCWGLNSEGQLGYGDATTRGDAPGKMGNALPFVDLGTMRTATSISAGAFHTCALLDNAHAKCWGWNNDGQLGLGDNTSRGKTAGTMGDQLATVDVGFAFGNVAGVAAGGTHTCARFIGGGVKCWGGNITGQLGLGDIASRGTSTAHMGTNLPFVSLGSGRSAWVIATDSTTGGASGGHTCAILDNDTLKCWGYNAAGELGQMRTGTQGDGPNEMGDMLPVTTLGTGRKPTSLALGKSHTCVLLDDATVKCFGEGASGRLGYGDTSTRGLAGGTMGDALPAIDIGTGRTALGISAGGIYAFSCALLDTRRLRCWGSTGTMLGIGLGSGVVKGDGAGEMGDALPFVLVP